MIFTPICGLFPLKQEIFQSKNHSFHTIIMLDIKTAPEKKGRKTRK